MVSKWSEVRIDQVAEKVAMGPFGSSIKVETFVPSGVPIISGQHLHGFRVNDEVGFNFISKEHAERLKNANAQRDDVIFTHRGNIGQVAYIPPNSKYERYVISQSQFYLRPDRSKVLPEFIVAYFKTPEGQYKLLANKSQVGVPSIAQPVTYLRTIEIPLPPISEQRTIAHILGTLNDKIELNRKMNKTLEAIARAIFKSWFVDFDPVIDNALAAGKPIPEEFAERTTRRAQLAHGKSSLPENIRRLFPDEFQDSELGPIPKGWEVGLVANLGNIVCGKTPPTSETANYGNEIPFITIPDMRDKVFVTSTARYLSTTGAATQPKKLLPPLSVCVSCIATPGLVALTSQPSHTNQQINSIVCRDDISPYWCYSKLVNMKNEIVTGGAGGSATLNLNKSQFSSLKLVLPRKHVIAAFHAKTTPLFTAILTASNQILALSAIRDLLLPRLLSGNLGIYEK